MTGSVHVAAVDLGASSGRVMLSRVGSNDLTLDAVARFPNGPVRLHAGLHWNVEELFGQARAGLRVAEVASGPERLRSIGIDAWGVDYGLLKHGELIAPPFCYRDEQRYSGVDIVHAQVPAEQLYRRSGLQFLPFNTIYQLAVEKRLPEADRVLLIPDLLTYELTGRSVAERTNASTTGLLAAHSGHWDEGLLATVGLSRSQMGDLVDPGTVVGDYKNVPVVAVGSHDTASAVVGVPMTEPAAYVSCGTWGLVGLELEQPLISDQSREANFTNERGVDGRIRFLTNVMGTWLLSETLRTWGIRDVAPLLGQAADYDGPITLFDVQDPRFLAPGDMPMRIKQWCTEHDLPVPDGRVALVRSIIASLVEGFARAVENALVLSGRTIKRVHVVGGGAQNALLCQLLATRIELPVFAGPVEATAVGNVLVQARTAGVLHGTLEDLRALVARTQPIRVHEPTGAITR